MFSGGLRLGFSLLVESPAKGRTVLRIFRPQLNRRSQELDRLLKCAFSHKDLTLAVERFRLGDSFGLTLLAPCRVGVVVAACLRIREHGIGLRDPRKQLVRGLAQGLETRS